EVAATDPAERGLDPDPVGAGQCRGLHVIQRDAAQRTERQGRPPLGNPARPQIASRTIMEPDRAQRAFSPCPRRSGKRAARSRQRRRVESEERVGKEATMNGGPGQESRPPCPTEWRRLV